MSQWRNSSSRGRVTKILIGINVLVFLMQISSNFAITPLLQLNPSNVVFAPWTLLTSGFAHASWMHILLNMYSLWIFGEALENFLGPRKFVWLYIASIIGGSIAVIFFTPDVLVVGASGGIFGLMGAYVVMIRALGYRSSQMLVLIGINIVFGFVQQGIAIAAHLGGLAVGALLAWNFIRRRR